MANPDDLKAQLMKKYQDAKTPTGDTNIPEVAPDRPAVEDNNFPKLNGMVNPTPMALNPMDGSKVISGLNTDPNAGLKQYIDNMKNNVGRATEIAQRPIWKETTPEEQDFVEKNLDPISRSVVAGGAIGSIAPIAEEGSVVAKGLMPKVISAVGHAADIADEAAPAIKNGFNKLQKMFQVGGVSYPAGSTAEALKIKSALEQTGKVPPNKVLTQIK
jgi:hypothetical protein